jgi:phosphoenolpyruvate-protein kinase (PTS system EI component)
MKLDDKTTIPLWSILVSVPTVMGAIFWISAVYYDVAQAKIEITKVANKQDQYLETLIEIKTTLARIEEKLGNKANR